MATTPKGYHPTRQRADNIHQWLLHKQWENECEMWGRYLGKLGENHIHNTAIKVPGPNQLNQIGEIVAVVKALEKAPTCVPLVIKTDSKYVINGLTMNLTHWEDKGWIEIKNREWFKRATYLLRKRLAPTKFQWVKGHSGETGNKESNKLMKQGANKNEDDYTARGSRTF